ncbi:MAG: FAD-dependent oxidoreductase [Bdellovibrionales bacterium]|nr:FAD-dependent oxidoreductase [Bdellovibrionales bacterium]
MTSLAIIGGGIAGKSLLFALAKSKKNFSHLTVFDSDSFAHTCSLRSTAVVAARGLTSGHSELGDLLIASFNTFSLHVQNDLPDGVFPITQFSAASTKLDQFKQRYPEGKSSRQFLDLSFNQDLYLAQEPAYLIDPAIYLKWLSDESRHLPLELKNDFVMSVEELPQGIEIKTNNGHVELFDSVIFAGGASNIFWREGIQDDLNKVKPVQGSYLEFKHADFGVRSFSLTLDGDNLIYHAHTKKLLLGSTTMPGQLEIAPVSSLQEIYQRLQSHLQTTLPDFATAEIKIGIREKAPKRSPYMLNQGKRWWIGGYYKNGYSLGYHWAEKLISKF